MAKDQLAQINGVKPNVLLRDGEEKEVSSMSSSTYRVKRTMNHYHCTCPAWRNQSKHPINTRTCKHLKSLLGDAYEAARLQSMGAATRDIARKPQSKLGKRKHGSDEDDKYEDDAAEPKTKRAREARSSPRKTTSPPKTIVHQTPELLLAKKWDLDTGLDPTGWWISEKLDGVRTYFDGKGFFSRLGNPFTPPKWFCQSLPKDVTLDGELFGGRGNFQETVSIVKTANSPRWKDIKFYIFDVPSLGNKPFEKRMEYLQKVFGPQGTHTSPHIVVVEQKRATGKQHILQRLKGVESLGGEGLMLRKPRSLYEGRRSDTLLKVKTFYDAEAVVTGYVPGRGKHEGATGALKCKMACGKAFNVGSGLSDKQRRKPSKVGSIIVYRFQELTRGGMPRFPSFVGEALDKTEPKDAELPQHRRTDAKDV